MNSLMIFLCIVVSEFVGVKSCNSKKDSIVWSATRKLTWKDFKGTDPQTYEFGAQSSIQIKLDYLVGDSLKKYDVICFFVPSASWTATASIYALNHEQKHFDIGEIVARRLRKNISEIKRDIQRENYKMLDSLYQNYKQVFVQLQYAYDSSTMYSRDRDQQQIWNLKIETTLDSLKSFAR